MPTIKEDTSGCNIAAINPFRYRGYYYDAETNLYYLQSRYYDPEIGRFINADDEKNACGGNGPLLSNIFAYCRNDPSNEYDTEGTLFLSIIKIVGKMLLGALMALLIQYLSNKIIGSLWKKKVDNTAGEYVATALQGAADAALNKGLAVDVLKSVLTSLLGQFVDLIRGRISSLSIGKIVESIIDGLMSGVLGKIGIDSPKYIKDIKTEARRKGIKGTKKLMQYLTKKKIKVSLHNFFSSNILSIGYNIVKQFIISLLDIVKTWASEMFNAIKESLCRVKEPCPV